MKEPKNGVYVRYHPKSNNKEVEYTFVDGKRHGIYQRWYENGLLMYKCNYVDGLMDGLFQDWLYDGSKHIECNYVMDKLQGSYKKWDNIGNLINDTFYVGGIEQK
jgi:antitoxin component YwqK of YwqJK toxin-antitoxin module